MRPLPDGIPFSIRFAFPKLPTWHSRSYPWPLPFAERARLRALTLESLEGRALLSTFPLVTTNAASRGLGGTARRSTLRSTRKARVPSARFQYSTDPSFPLTVSTIIGSGFGGPTGVAVDAAGDVFVADAGNRRRQRRSCPTAPSSPLAPGSTPRSASRWTPTGDVFVADAGNSAVTEVEPDGTIDPIGSQFQRPGRAWRWMRPATSSSPTSGTSTLVKEVLPDGTINTIGSGFGRRSGVAVDAAGDVFVADTSNNAVKEV